MYPNSDWDHEEQFHRMEECLKSFILDKRTRTKLAPAKNFLLNLLGDIRVVSGFNHSAALSEFSKTTELLKKQQSSLQKYRHSKDHYLLSLRQIAVSACDQVENHGKSRFADFMDHLEEFADVPGWYGLFHIFNYIDELRDGIIHQIDWRLKQCRDFAKRTIVETVANLQQATKEIGSDLSIVSLSHKVSPAAINQYFSDHSKNRDVILKQLDFAVEPSDFVDEAKVGAFFVGLSAAGFSCTFSGLWRMGNNIGAASIAKMAVGIGNGPEKYLYLCSHSDIKVLRQCATPFRTCEVVCNGKCCES
jgi:mitofusin